MKWRSTRTGTGGTSLETRETGRKPQIKYHVAVLKMIFPINTERAKVGP
jgi:hypothetical protein